MPPYTLSHSQFPHTSVNSDMASQGEYRLGAHCIFRYRVSSRTTLRKRPLAVGTLHALMLSQSAEGCEEIRAFSQDVRCINGRKEDRLGGDPDSRWRVIVVHIWRGRCDDDTRGCGKVLEQVPKHDDREVGAVSGASLVFAVVVLTFHSTLTVEAPEKTAEVIVGFITGDTTLIRQSDADDLLVESSIVNHIAEFTQRSRTSSRVPRAVSVLPLSSSDRHPPKSSHAGRPNAHITACTSTVCTLSRCPPRNRRRN